MGLFFMNDETREAARQWRTKAQSDRAAVEILTASDRCPPDTVCFHCQQSVEKLLKALLSLNGIETPRTHDLRRLIRLAEPFAPDLAQLVDAADTLTPYTTNRPILRGSRRFWVRRTLGEALVQGWRGGFCG